MITRCIPSQCTVRKSHRTLIATIYQEDKLSKTTSYLLHFKMIEKKIEMIEALQNKTWNKHRTSTMGAAIKNESTRTEPPP